MLIIVLQHLDVLGNYFEILNFFYHTIIRRRKSNIFMLTGSFVSLFKEDKIKLKSQNLTDLLSLWGLLATAVRMVLIKNDI